MEINIPQLLRARYPLVLRPMQRRSLHRVCTGAWTAPQCCLLSCGSGSTRFDIQSSLLPQFAHSLDEKLRKMASAVAPLGGANG
ncbi:hypothetical protein [Comamonas testosteroni]|uniref:hypothetical protein n=1 Tax=Comamonas testosteroni TaxID=285 RepID=UPI0026EE2950|nr:hypothetical protein [Comamonas testosteroni]